MMFFARRPDRKLLALILVVALPAILVLAGAITPIVLSLNYMASEVDQTEAILTARKADAALQSITRHLGETQGDYAVWDEAVRKLYGTLDPVFVEENFSTPTGEGGPFDTAYLLDENRRDVFGYRNGKPAEDDSAVVFGPVLSEMVARLPSDGRTYALETGIVRGKWGLAALAVGPVVPNTTTFGDPPTRSRMLVIAKTFDDATVQRLGEDFVLKDLLLVDAPDGSGIAIVNPSGQSIGGLAWAPPQLGSAARRQVNPTVFIMLGVLVIAMFALVAFAVRALRRRDELTGSLRAQERLLDAALTNLPHGLCMFDADKRLLISNARYRNMYSLPARLVEPGTPLSAIIEYRESIGNAPVDFPHYAPHNDFAIGANRVFEFALADGRSIRLNRLSLNSGGYVATHEDVTEMVRTATRINYMAKYDALTNLPNRTFFRQKAETAIASVTQEHRAALLCLDLDQFKAVNDTLGHPIGDVLLTSVADRLRGCLRETDTVARLGGDEFAILQPRAEQPSGAAELAGRIIEVLSAPYDLDGHQVVIGVSVGIALAPDDGADPDQLLKSADLALYRAKADGRGRHCFFEPAMDARMQARRKLEIGLRKALREEEFELHYQPILNLEHNFVTGFEALLRWKDPERGLVSPSEFIRLAEETGLIIPIGEWVLRRACADAASWPRDLRVAVNLSPAQFGSNGLSALVFSALAAANLRPNRLELEITELVLLKNTARTMAKLHALHDFGVRISMDDFGTGYSSLSYLRSFPFDKIKIDQSFIRDLAGSDDSLAIVRAVTGLGTALSMTITAEGVETLAQLECLRHEGCTEVQGFLFSKPRPLSELQEFLADPKLLTASAA